MTGPSSPPMADVLLQVRQVRPSEYERVTEICLAAYAPSGMPADHPYWALLADTAARAGGSSTEPGSQVWVAVDPGGAVVGTVTWCPYGSAHREVSTETEAEFRMLAVDPTRQGAGIGSTLLRTVVERARDELCTAVVLSSAQWMTSAHRLYERAGFERTPHLDWEPTPGLLLRTYRVDLR